MAHRNMWRGWFLSVWNLLCRLLAVKCTITKVLRFKQTRKNDNKWGWAHKLLRKLYFFPIEKERKWKKIFKRINNDGSCRFIFLLSLEARSKWGIILHRWKPPACEWWWKNFNFRSKGFMNQFSTFSHFSL